MPIRLLLLIVAVLVVASCAPDEPADDGLSDIGLDGFATATIWIDDRELVVAFAETPNQRSQGLMGVTDLGGLDGMLFVFQSESNGGFWMKDTLIPLDIAFFDGAGVLVDELTMEPCTADPCPSYRSRGSYRYAVEAPAGDLGFVVPGSRLVIVE
jgi:uncharacterized membrane protein (UPF0127 family)